jgi:hypothetical protein
LQHRYWRVATLDKREEKESEKNQIRVGWSRGGVRAPEYPPPISSSCAASYFPWSSRSKEKVYINNGGKKKQQNTNYY